MRIFVLNNALNGMPRLQKPFFIVIPFVVLNFSLVSASLGRHLIG